MEPLERMTFLKVAAIVRLTAEFGRTQGVAHGLAEQQAKQMWAEIEDLAAIMEQGITRE